jgi:hypothetical protein
MGMDFFNNLVVTNTAFSTATLVYTRMRRVTGRVVDAVYLSENKDYAKHVIDLALDSDDAELIKHATNLKNILGIFDVEEESLEQEPESYMAKVDELLPSVEPTDEDIYSAQVSHHYIGSLR